MKCRHCNSENLTPFLDLGCSPPSNAYLECNQLDSPEVYLPLKVAVCRECWLAQTVDYSRPSDLFDDRYAYFSSISKMWLEHARAYSSMIIEKLRLDSSSFVVEIASNDGYLLKNFLQSDIPCLGIEPTASTAEVAESLGIPVLREFFGEELGKVLNEKGQKADLIIANNVFAHVPDINDFSLGFKALLKSNGVVTIEFPHLLRLIKDVQFDTVYHEHFSYISLMAAERILTQAGLRIWDVEEIPTHGGSLRIYCCHDYDSRQTFSAVNEIKEQEIAFGLSNIRTYEDFQQRAVFSKNKLLAFLIQEKLQGRTTVAYGAAAKGNTLLNFAGIKPDLLAVVYDAAPSKQGKFLPGSRIPIENPQLLGKNVLPNNVLILPWNIAAEVKSQLSWLSEKGTKFYKAIPELEQI